MQKRQDDPDTEPERRYEMGQSKVDQLVEIFGDLSDQEIDILVAQGKTRRIERVETQKKERLSQLFDNALQALIQGLTRAGVPREIRELVENEFRTQKSGVVEKAQAMDFAEGEMPFVLIPSGNVLSVAIQVLMLENDGKQGYSWLKPWEITDVVDVPTRPYVIFGVEDGTAMLGKAPKAAEKAIKQQWRRSLTAIEAINLCVQKSVLAHHFVDALGSRYGSELFPGVYLGGGRPRLDYLGLGDGGFSGWGAASCRSV